MQYKWYLVKMVSYYEINLFKMGVTESIKRKIVGAHCESHYLLYYDVIVISLCSVLIKKKSVWMTRNSD